ncbi:MAG TPA: hypothetical protein DCZ80_05680 [Legionellales bacterium]|nr:hypothetical protein [Legionellales bacterium]
MQIMKKYFFSLTFFLFVSSQLFSATMTSASSCDKHISNSLIDSFEKGVDWKKYFADVYNKALNCNDQANIAIINIIDDQGYPVGLPVHFEFKNATFYFSSNVQSKRNEHLKQNHHVSLLIYYKSIDQSTFLIKGQALATQIKYQYPGEQQNHTQIIYKIEPEEVNISFLNGSTRINKDIIRHLYVYKKDNTNQWLQSKRLIHLQNEFDDLEEILKQGSKELISKIYPNK